MAASGLVGTLELGEIGLLLAPLGGAAGVVSSAVLGGLAGANLGKLIDKQILDNNLCDSCGHCFSDDDAQQSR
jgi:outer membrane lipoprotein SlyB